MHPAFSVIFLTTLIGVGQGLFLALFTEQSYSALGLLPALQLFPHHELMAERHRATR